MVLCVRRVQLGFWPLGVRDYLGFGEDQRVKRLASVENK